MNAERSKRLVEATELLEQARSIINEVVTGEQEDYIMLNRETKQAKQLSRNSTDLSGLWYELARVTHDVQKVSER